MAKKKTKKKLKKSPAEIAANKRGYTIIAKPTSGKEFVKKLLASFENEDALLDAIEKSLKQTRKNARNAPDFLKEAKKKSKRRKR